jgi:glutamine synthetase
MLPAETQRIIDKHGIKYVLAQFVDIHGRPRPNRCRFRAQDGGRRGRRFAGFAISGMGMEPHGPDFMARGDLST